MRVMTILGTRPEIIRLSRVIDRLDRTLDHLIVHTGQNSDYELNEIFFEELAIRRPDHFLGVDTSTLGRALGGIIVGAEEVLRAEQPDAVLVLGDTNSSIAAVMAKRMKIPVYHMEAGNRCFDANVPEEVNRRIIDHTADFNLVYTERARHNLLREGLHPRRVYLTGSPLCEVLEHHRPQIEGSGVLASLELTPGEFFLVSMHREENVDNADNLRELVTAFSALARENGVGVIVSTHPRTRSRLDAMPDLDIDERVHFAKPFGFFDYNKLQSSARCVLSDSGTIAEESAILGFPAVTIRNSMERPEAMDTGSIVITGVDADNVRESVRVVLADWATGTRPEIPPEYRVQNCSQRVVNLIVGTAKLHQTWDSLYVGPRWWEEERFADA